MARVYISSVIDVPATRVWERVRDFNGLPRWHPSIRDSRIENGEPADKVGCIRDFHLQNGDRIREQLLGLSDYDMFCTYSILESPMPLTDYVATLRLTPITDGDRCFAEWSAEFECADEEEEGLVNGIGNDVFQAGFSALKRQLATRRREFRTWSKWSKAQSSKRRWRRFGPSCGISMGTTNGTLRWHKALSSVATLPTWWAVCAVSGLPMARSCGSGF
jgi:hypothetical protein